jgi:hypothetical protein
MSIIQIAIPQTRIDVERESPDKRLVSVDLFNNGINQFETFELNKDLVSPALIPIQVEVDDLELSDSIKIDLDNTIVLFLPEEGEQYEKDQIYFFPIFRELVNPQVALTRFNTEFTEL